MSLEIVQTADAPPPAGHYSQAIVHGNVAYVCGCLPIEPHTGRHVHGTIEEETRQVLENIFVILAAAGSAPSRVLSVTVYVVDIELWPKVNEVYAAAFGNHRPARTVVTVEKLHHDFLIEISAIAAV